MYSTAGSSLLDKSKVSPVIGTPDPNAFILSLRGDDNTTNVHSYGIHSVPHLGRY